MVLQAIMVTGEITNMRFYGSTLYFEISDGIGSLNAVMYDADKKLAKLNIEPGLNIQAKGSVKFYAKKGKITFQASYLTPAGQGGLNAAFEKRKAKLAAEGLFDDARKRPLPPYPGHIALVTANESAAMWDVVSIMKDKMPQCTITICPATVQGANCPREVVAGIHAAEAIPGVECLIVMRGGGSPEDLAGFNDEQLVRRVAACQVPVISAVGHEIDFSLCDFAADYRAPTPSAAAHHIAQPFTMKKEQLLDKLWRAGDTLDQRIAQTKDHVTDLIHDISATPNTLFKEQKSTFSQLQKRLISANPLHKLSQGYSIVRNENGSIIKSATQVGTGDTIEIQLCDETIKAMVN